MDIVKRLSWYFNPIEHLGNKERSFLFPLFANLFVCILSEIYCYAIAKNPLAVGLYIIFVNVALVIYFAFRDGIRGGVISAIIAVAYYFYIIFTRDYKGQMFVSATETTIMLGFIYLLLAVTIGWLKQIIDNLIERETDAKRRLEAIVQQMPVGVVITDNRGNIIQANKQLTEMLGIELPMDYEVSKNGPLFMNRKKNKIKFKSKSPVITAIMQNKGIIGKEYGFLKKDGDKIFIRLNSSPIYSQEGKLIAAVSVISDITNKKKLEERKDDFINMASHELKTPLTSLKMFTQVLKRHLEKNKDERALQFTERINSQLDSIGNLIQQLLDVTQMQKKEINVEKKPFYIKQLAEEVKTDLQLTSDQHIEIDWHTKIPVLGDKEKIRQVLSNLVTNAIKYSPHGKSIYIRSEKKGKSIEVSVEDQGIGIPKNQQRKIFDRFYRVATDSTYPGLGLGLYISARIIKQHGGKIWVKSREGKGSTFFFTLPEYKKTNRNKASFRRSY